MNTIFEELEQSLANEGPESAISLLCERLKAEKAYDRLFYARLMARRHQLGLCPIPTAATTDLPEDKQEGLEEAIRDACREVGGLYLEQGDLPQAWMYYRTIGETEAVEKALAEYEPLDEDETFEDVIQIALNEGINPQKGFDWVLDRYGLCSAITTLGSQQIPGGEEVRRYCIGQVLRALYEELRERLIADIEEQEGKAPPEAEMPPGSPGVVRQLITGRDFLFGEHSYHVDLSHLSSVIQMSIELTPGEDLELARELCEYGSKLQVDYQTSGDPPFDHQYKDYGVYLSALAGENVDAAIAHFKKKIEDNPVEEYGTYPVEVCAQLLQRLNRDREAAELACEHLAEVDAAQLNFVAGLCEKAEAYDSLTRVAREQNHPVQFMAGLLASRSKPSGG